MPASEAIVLQIRAEPCLQADRQHDAPPQSIEAEVGKRIGKRKHTAPQMRTIKEYRGLRGGSASSRPVKMLAAAGPHPVGPT